MRAPVEPHPFRPLGDETAHYWMVSRMARATGADLVTAMETGRLTSAAWADMVTACRGCLRTEECGKWLDRVGESKHDVPSGCVNREIFTALRAASGADVTGDMT